jgi:hypothetical protein
MTNKYHDNEIVERCRELNNKYDFSFVVDVDSENGTVSDDNFHFTIKAGKPSGDPINFIKLETVLDHVGVIQAHHFLDGIEYISKDLDLDKL